MEQPLWTVETMVSIVGKRKAYINARMAGMKEHLHPIKLPGQARTLWYDIVDVFWIKEHIDEYQQSRTGVKAKKKTTTEELETEFLSSIPEVRVYNKGPKTREYNRKVELPADYIKVMDIVDGLENIDQLTKKERIQKVYSSVYSLGGVTKIGTIVCVKIGEDSERIARIAQRIVDEIYNDAPENYLKHTIRLSKDGNYEVTTRQCPTCDEEHHIMSVIEVKRLFD